MKRDKEGAFGNYSYLMAYLYAHMTTGLYVFVPTDLFTAPKPRDQEIGQFYVVQKRSVTDLEAPK